MNRRSKSHVRRVYGPKAARRGSGWWVERHSTDVAPLKPLTYNPMALRQALGR